MSILSTTEKLTHVTAVPSSKSREEVLALLRDNEHFLECSPHKAKREPIPTPSPAPKLPAGLEAKGETKCYKVTDVFHALPAGLWDSDVVSTYEFTDIENGLFVRIKSPMSVQLDTIWTVAENAAGNGNEGLQLKEEVTISCSRLLIGPVKGACEGNWKSIHGNMLAGPRSESA